MKKKKKRNYLEYIWENLKLESIVLISAVAINCVRKKNSIHSKILMETASIFRDKGAKGMKLDCQRI